jgi:hypothetical protein
MTAAWRIAAIVGDDVDILSGTGSLESTLTASDFIKLGTKTSTLKGSESFPESANGSCLADL